MPQTTIEWLSLLAVAYVWMGLGIIATDFGASPLHRPGYARRRGPHVLFVALGIPISSLIFFTVGGPGRVMKFLVASVVHFGLTLLAFWLLGLVVEDVRIRLAILGGVLVVFALPFAIPTRG
ncbi:MAG: hypothetical protein ABL864_09925 [Terricaulis sp.]